MGIYLGSKYIIIKIYTYNNGVYIEKVTLYRLRNIDWINVQSYSFRKN